MSFFHPATDSLSRHISSRPLLFRRLRAFVPLLFLLLSVPLAGNASSAGTVTIKAVDRPAAEVFRAILSQTGRNFVYSSGLLENLRVTVEADRRPLEEVLGQMFAGTDITYLMRGDNIILRRRPSPRSHPDRRPSPRPAMTASRFSVPTELSEVVVVSRLEEPAVETAEIGASKLTADEVRAVPALLGERDVIKTLQYQPGVAAGAEGMAGMYVHGGNADENLCMLDNVPLYQVNHFGGLFSAFNTEAIRYIDFFKSSVPAKYDGRLSSFLDVRTKDGSPEGHHGSASLGLTSGSFNIDGPLGKRTTYAVALRRSWYDLITIPALAIANSGSNEKINLRYYFMDLNAKLTYRFNSRTTGFLSTYFGDDLLKSGDRDVDNGTTGYFYDDTYRLHWGNFVVRAGLNRRMRENMTGEFTAAFTRFFSGYSSDETEKEVLDTTRIANSRLRTDNHINDWILRADFDWRPSGSSRVRFGGSYVSHSFLPGRTSREYTIEDTRVRATDSTATYRANEFNAYIEDDMELGRYWRVNAGLHASVFAIGERTFFRPSPRLSVSFRPSEGWSVKGAYSHTVQYVHQLAQTYLSLPTDQWIPVAGDLRPQLSDKIALGVYHQSPDGRFAVSMEGYWRWMRNLIDFTDEYYLRPPLERWDARLTSGRGTAKGVDIKVEKTSGPLTGHLSYSLAWADRTFPGRNGGLTFPARFDNRHTVNILLSWKISRKVDLNALWTGHSGSRFTLLPQVWEEPPFDNSYFSASTVALRGKINNYRLPFYHRLDLSLTVRNSRGFWTFGLYNAYCHLNAIAIRRTYKDVAPVILPDGSVEYSVRPVFQKVCLLPLIPSVSYTWQF